jgi:hypothetical protein
MVVLIVAMFTGSINLIHFYSGYTLSTSTVSVKTLTMRMDTHVVVQ